MTRTVNDFKRPDSALVAQYREVAGCYSASCVFADVRHRRGVMHSSIKPILSGKLVGPALAVKLSPGDLVDPLDALMLAQSGDVIVVDANGETETSVWGGLMGGLCLQRGVKGAIVDGAVRDIDELRDMEFLLFSRSVTPRGTHTMYSGRKDELQINVPISCGGVVVHPGDMIVGDENGVTVIPRADVESVLELAREQAQREEATRQQIAKGKTVEQLLDEFGRI
ncbi:MAG: RraA family protein [Alphaproteobacteria bacterium]